MKTSKLLFIVALILSVSCAKKKVYKGLEGYWATYELVRQDGTVQTENLNTMSFFGVYDGGVQFKKDLTYEPFSWQNAGRIMKPTEAGRYEYTPRSSELKLTGGFMDMTFKVEKLEDDELWLKNTGEIGNLLKLKRD